ncbi:MAG: peptide chain release factor N(5)-glutamine methyltransferase [Prevotellaceae bacterium]|jgi:release factor glutamine methyltransferase|nr:peptide chain release factor N(5)-glutamine methyltransferase [Prevotellaceae bacterium]
MFDYIKQSLNQIYTSREAQQLAVRVLQHVTGLSQAAVLTCKDTILSEHQHKEIADIVRRLQKNEPIAYVLGETTFYGLPFSVNSHTLIPRPETEELVDWIVRNHKNDNPRILDIGTGSGCIAVALAKNIAGSKVFAMDISAEALEIAKKNADINNVEIEFIQADIFDLRFAICDLRLATCDLRDFDIIVSNPPYVCEREKADMQDNVLLYEPHRALFVPDDEPLKFYRAIADFASLSACLYFEINRAFGQEICAMLREMGFSDIELRKDDYGNDRMIKVWNTKKP